MLISAFASSISKSSHFIGQMLLFVGTGFLSVGMFFAILYVISLFKRDLKRAKPLESKSDYSKEVYNPLILLVKISMLISLSSAFFSAFIFAYFIWILHRTFITSVDLLISVALNFLFEILFSMIVLPRIDLFKEVKPGEVKIIRIPKFVHGGLTTGVLTLSRSSLFKEIVFVSDHTDKSLEKLIESHELAHAKEYHPIFLQLAGMLLVSIVDPLLFFSAFSYIVHLININSLLVIKTFLVVLSTGVLTLLLVRVAESRADAFTFKMVGEKAYENLVELLRINYGENIKNTREAPLFSRITHTSSRNALKTGDPLSSLGIWEFPATLSFVATTIEMIHAKSINIIELFPFLYVGTLAILFLLGLIFLPIVKKYYVMTERGSMNFSFLLAGLYIILSVSALNEYPNIYSIFLLFLLGIFLIFMIAKTFMWTRNALKVVMTTLLIYLAVSAIVSAIGILSHGLQYVIQALGE